MEYRLLCPADGQSLTNALEATIEFAHILRTLRDVPFQPAESLRALGAHGSSLVLAETLALGAALTCWLLYLLTRNCSHVDRMWSILPPIYVAIFSRRDLAAALAAVQRELSTHDVAGGIESMPSWLTAVCNAVAHSGADPRLLLATILVTAWGCRLTFNFWRRGGYNPHFEDHRWPEARKIMHPVMFELFNLVFVALAQHVLCLLLTLPAFVAATEGRKGGALPPPLGAADWAAAGAFALFLLGETIADEQQWTFQKRKQELLSSRQSRSGDYKRGFRSTGLFRFSRHPNFFCEYCIWWSFYVLCAVLPCRCLLGWAAAGAVGLTALFHFGSLWITERVSATKYPDYAAYQAATSAIVPGWPGPRLEQEVGGSN